MFALYLLVAGESRHTPEPGFDRLALAGYMVTAATIVLASAISGAGELALIGFFSMMPWVITGWLRMGEA